MSWRESEVRTTAQRLDDIRAASASCSGAPSDTAARLGTEAEVGSSGGVVARYRPYKCSACGRRSNWRWDLKKHVESTHAGTPALIIRLRDDVARATYDDVLAAQGGRTGVRLQRRPRDADRRLPADHTGRRLPVSPSVCLSVCVCVCVCVCAWTIHKWAQSVHTENRQGGNVDECGKYVCLHVCLSVCLLNITTSPAELLKCSRHRLVCVQSAVCCMPKVSCIRSGPDGLAEEEVLGVISPIVLWSVARIAGWVNFRLCLNLTFVFVIILWCIFT